MWAAASASRPAREAHARARARPSLPPKNTRERTAERASRAPCPTDAITSRRPPALVMARRPAPPSPCRQGQPGTPWRPVAFEPSYRWINPVQIVGDFAQRQPHSPTMVTVHRTGSPSFGATAQRRLRIHPRSRHCRSNETGRLRFSFLAARKPQSAVILIRTRRPALIRRLTRLSFMRWSAGRRAYP
jgi:hypothetical protein